MTLSEARRVLGLEPDENPRPRLPEFHLTRQRLASMLDNEPNIAVATCYQRWLLDFDCAFAVVCDPLGGESQATPATPEVPSAAIGPDATSGGQQAVRLLSWTTDIPSVASPADEPEASLEGEQALLLSWTTGFQPDVSSAGSEDVLPILIGATSVFLSENHQPTERATSLEEVPTSSEEETVVAFSPSAEMATEAAGLLPRSRRRARLAGVFILLLAAAGVLMHHHGKSQQLVRQQTLSRIAELGAAAAAHLETRRWHDA
ncbi:MAG: hypothetical protein WCJ66_16825, partial [Verrucomicrobiota bacterium]